MAKTISAKSRNKKKKQAPLKSKYISEFKPEAHKISDIIGKYATRIAVIPKFQREFRWKKEQVEDFVSDIHEFFKNGYSISPQSAYFMGPVVTKDENDFVYILDGQQRLATSIIFLAVIRDILNDETIFGSIKEKASTQASRIQGEFIERESESEPVYTLELGDIDKLYFRDVIQKMDGLRPLHKKADLTSHEAIRVAYRTIKNEITNYVNNISGNDNQLKFLLGMRDSLVIGTKVIAIDVKEDWSAYKIFETLNDRGLRLSVSDLLLNFLLSKAKASQARGSIRAKWDGMLNDLKNKDLSVFFRYSWISRNGDLKSHNLYHELSSQIESTQLTSEDFVNNCMEDLKIYHIILDDKNLELPKLHRTYMQGLIKNYRSMRTIPLLMTIRRALNLENQLKSVILLNKFIFRYNVVMDFNTSKLESILFAAANNMSINKNQNKNQRNIYDEFKIEIENEMPPDSAVKQKLIDFDISDNNEALWTLMQIELHHTPTFKNNDLDILSLEHIFPENPDKSVWKNATSLKPLTYRLGNLALLTQSDNSEVGNKSIAVKAARFKNFSNSTNPDVNTLTWDKAIITTRTKDLIEKLIVII